MPPYEYRHAVGFAETSLVGNVYFASYIEWQGTCRERFLSEHARDSVERLMRREVAFFTRNCSCEYIGEWGFTALDEVLVRMRLERFRGGRMTLAFEYAHADRPDELVARGTQEVACKALRAGTWVAAPFPASLASALLPFADTDELREHLNDVLAFEGGEPPASNERRPALE